MTEEQANIQKETEKNVFKPSRNHLLWKWLLGVLIFTMVVFLGFAKFTGFVAGRLIKSKVEEYSNGVYTVDFNNLVINWDNSEIALKGFTYNRINPNLPIKNDVSFSAKSASIDLESITGIYFEKALHVEYFTINNPQVAIHQSEKSSDNQNFSFKTGNLFKVVQGFVKSFQIDNFKVNHLYLDYSQDYEEPVHYIVNDLTLGIHNFKLDSTAVAENSDFFFTESVSVKLSNQTIALGDGIHKVHFDSLRLNTMLNRIEVFNTRVDSLDSPTKKTNNVQWNRYHTHLPYLGVKGLNFLRAYQENVLEVDSLLLNDIEFSAEMGSLFHKEGKHSEIQIDTTVSNGVIAILLQVFDSYQLHQFQINRANGKMDLIQNDEYAELKNLNLEFTGFQLDSTDITQEDYYPVFKGLKLDIETPSFKIPNGDNISASKLFVSTYDSSIIVDEVKINSRNGEDRDISIAELKITGVSPKQILQDQKIRIKELIIKNPEIKVVNNYDQEQSIKLNLSSFITDKVSEYQIKKVVITNGIVDLDKGKNDIRRVNVSLDDFKISESELRKAKFLFSKRARLEFKNVKTEIPNVQHDLRIKSLKLDSWGGKVQWDDWSISPNIFDSSTVKFITHSKGEVLALKGVDFANLTRPKDIDLSEVKLFHMNSKIELMVPDTHEEKSKNDLSVFLKTLDSIKLANVNLDSLEVAVYKEGRTVAKFSNSMFTSRLLEADTAELYKGVLLITGDSNSFIIEKLFVPLKKSFHDLSVQSIIKSGDSNLVVKNITLTPSVWPRVPDSVASINVKIPQLTTSDFRVLGHQNVDTLTLGEVRLFQPQFKMKMAKKKKSVTKDFSLPEQLPEDFIDEVFQMLHVKGFHIEEGRFELRNDSMLAKVDDLELNSENWEISKSSTWDKKRFLYASDFNLKLKDIHLDFPGIDSCHNIDSIHYQFTPNRLDVHGVYYNNKRDETLATSEYSIFMPRISVTGLDWHSYITGKDLIIQEVSSKGGFLEYDQYPSLSKNVKPFQLPEEFPEMKGITSIKVHQLDVNQMDVQMRMHKSNRVSPLDMDHFSLVVDSFHVYPGERMDSFRLFWSDNIEASVNNVFTHVDNGLYELGADQISFSTQKKILEIVGFSLIPNVPRIEYALHKGGFQKDVFDLNVAGLAINHLRFDKLLRDQRLEGNQLVVNQPDLKVFKDKRNPYNTDVYKEILPEVFKKAPIKVDLDSVLVEDMKISYEEFPSKGRNTGKIILTDTYITAKNFTNDTTKLELDSALTIVMNSKFLGTSDLYLTLEYDMLTPDNEFFMYSTLGEMDATLLNKYTYPAYNANIKSGDVHKMQMHAFGNDSLSAGKMNMFYSDLKFEFLDEEDHHAKSFKNFVGNNFVIKTKNKYSYFKKPQDIFVVRNTQKGWINYLIKIELNGAQANAGINRKQGKEAKKANKKAWKDFEQKSKERLKEEGKQQKQRDKEARKLLRQSK